MVTRVLSVRGRLRAALELVVPPRRNGRDESIAQFARRRFGSEAYEWLIEPLLGGIFAGDGEALSLAATFPQLADMERSQGAVLRSLWRAGRRDGGGGGEGPVGFVTLERGLGEIVAALDGKLADRIRTGAAVTGLRLVDGAWRVELASRAAVTASAVILAVPAFAAARLLTGTDAALAAELSAIPFVDVATVSAAFPRGVAARPLAGYGYVSPRAEGGTVVACTWTSNKFPARAPQDAVLLRFFLGRAGGGDVMGTDDEGLKAQVRAELAAMFGITHEPGLWRIHRWPRGMPQYVVGHRARLARIDEGLARLPGLALAGASYQGVGIPDCIASGWRAADTVLASAGVAT
jgi:oxygen-dependent protoporphyrinogen oxidase